MKTVTSKWFICTIAYEKTYEDGLQKNVKELYVVDALSFAEAEKRVTEEMANYISGVFGVVEIDAAPFSEIFIDDEHQADYWYKAKLKFITIDERTEKEKFTTVNYLVQASSFEDANKNIKQVMDKTMIDYVVSSVTETKIVDVFGHE